ncbi:hypothetical protein ACFLYL_04800 [Chloroflexota bacterium]
MSVWGINKVMTAEGYNMSALWKVAATIGIGRAATNIVVTDICDALRFHRSIPAAAESLGCSPALIYKILKANGMISADIIKGITTKGMKLFQKGGLNDGWSE